MTIMTIIDSSSSNPLTARRPKQSMAVPDTAVAASLAAVAPPSKSVVTFETSWELQSFQNLSHIVNPSAFGCTVSNSVT